MSLQRRVITLREGQSVRFRCRGRIIIVRCRRRRRHDET